MPKQNPNTETVDFRFVLTDKPGSPRILVAKWLRSHKTEALDFLLRAMKPEMSADNGANPNQIYGAKIESAAFHRYMAEALTAQIAIDRDELPVMAEAHLIRQMPIITSTSPPQTPSSIASSDGDDDGWDDDEPYTPEY